MSFSGACLTFKLPVRCLLNHPVCQYINKNIILFLVWHISKGTKCNAAHLWPFSIIVPLKVSYMVKQWLNYNSSPRKNYCLYKQFCLHFYWLYKEICLGKCGALSRINYTPLFMSPRLHLIRRKITQCYCFPLFKFDFL